MKRRIGKRKKEKIRGEDKRELERKYLIEREARIGRGGDENWKCGMRMMREGRRILRWNE